MTALVAAPPRRMWIGPFEHEAAKAYVRALDAGADATGALVEGIVASFRDCWAPRATIAKQIGRSVRTVQRKLTRAAVAGRMAKARSKPGEVPPGAKAPMWCGFSHRWTAGWGKAGDDVARDVERFRLRQLERRTVANMYASTRPPRRALASASAPRTRWAAFAPKAPALPSSAASSPKQKSPPTPSSVDKRWTADALDRELERIDRERKARDGPD